MTFHISINDWLPFKYFLHQLDSTFICSLLPMTLRRLLHALIEDDKLQVLFKMISTLWLLDGISHFDPIWFHFAPWFLDLLLRRLLLPLVYIEDDSHIEDDILRTFKKMIPNYDCWMTTFHISISFVSLIPLCSWLHITW